MGYGRSAEPYYRLSLPRTGVTFGAAFEVGHREPTNARGVGESPVSGLYCRVARPSPHTLRRMCLRPCGMH